MGKKSLAVLVMATTFFYLTDCGSESADVLRQKIPLRVLYLGHPATPRETDFVGFLEKHFKKVGKGDIDKFEENNAEGFDVVILDYCGLTIKGNAIVVPRVPFDRSYSRPVLTIGAAGALACDHLGLKTGYL